MLVLVLLVPICFGIARVNKVPKKSVLIAQSLGLGFAVFLIASIVSFFVYTDALNMLVFLFLYTAAFLLSGLINIGMILVKKRWIGDS
ncbi:hypothetical protein [Paenibacillus flagellatus]|nr:hypothetical protein [Paenibacillus flagellatus]